MRAIGCDSCLGQIVGLVALRATGVSASSTSHMGTTLLELAVVRHWAQVNFESLVDGDEVV